MKPAPLAEILRPESLDDFIGQKHLVGPSGVIRRFIERGNIPSMIFWGPPGCGKTSLARIIANSTIMQSASTAHFVGLSAVTCGVKEVREVVSEAERRRTKESQSTILFLDEIHRFNKSQQDALLPHVEKGTLTLIGATTENPSFELNSALLSRARVYIFNQLEPEELGEVIDKVVRRLDGTLSLSDEAKGYLIALANGDARSLITSLEILSSEEKPDISKDDAEAILQRKMLIYDKSGEEHFNLISALHKSLRNSDVQASIYWLARMLEGGEDPLYLARRLIRFASEDIGNAEPLALQLAVAAKDTVEFLGMPECSNALTQLVVFMASAPKSNSAYRAYGAAREAVYRTQHEPVPLHLRNAPTKLMKEVGYGEGYKYAHDYEAGVTNMSCLPDRLKNVEFYAPVERGFEREIKKRMEYWERERKSR